MKELTITRNELILIILINNNKWQKYQIDHAKQKDGFNCGVFCLIFIERFLELNLNYENEISSDFLTSYRKNIYDTLVNFC